MCSSRTMSCTFVVVTILLGSSAVIAFVLQPSEDDPAASEAPVAHRRCQAESLQSIRKSLLGAFNLQAEPQLPAGGLDGVREQWRTTFSIAAHRATDAAIPAASGNSVSRDVGNSTSLRCCSMASEVFMKDLGWDNWVLHPASLTVVQCALCHPEGSAGQCPSPDGQDADSQGPCCEPLTQESVPVLYADAFSTLVISSVPLTRSCGCGLQPPSRE
ncbi:gonadal somatic cell derived factor [Clinocottus analis]|uniref:gonadal somatic cell derived factor n=1 Tax=Clinocottus analis TaxID=304258 RepID=UPI0035BF8E88